MEVPPLPEDPLKRKAKPLAIPPSPPRQEPPFETWRLDYESDLEQMVEDDYAIQYGPGVLGISILLRSAFVFFVLLLAFLLLPASQPDCRRRARHAVVRTPVLRHLLERVARHQLRHPDSRELLDAWHAVQRAGGIHRRRRYLAPDQRLGLHGREPVGLAYSTA